MGGGNVSVLDPGLGDADTDADALAGDEYRLALGFGGGRFGFRAQGGGEGGGGEGEWGGEDRAGGKRDEDGDARKGKRKKKPVGPPRAVPRARVVPALLDVAFAGRPLNCEPEQCDVLAEMFEWRQAHNLQKAGRYKYVLDVRVAFFTLPLPFTSFRFLTILSPSVSFTVTLTFLLWPPLLRIKY
jgi:hypothetical protein